MKTALRVAGSLALVGLLVWRLDIDEVWRGLAGVRAGWWLAAFGCYLVAQLVSSVRWRALAAPLGFTRPTGDYLAFYFVGNFFNLILPTSVGGDVVRAWYLGRGTGRGASAALSVLADRLIGLYVLVALACIAAPAVPLPGWVAGWVVFAGVSGLAGLVLLLFIKRAGNATAIRQPRLRELAAALDLYTGSPRLLIEALGLSLVVQVLNVVLVWFVALSLNVAVPLGYCFVLVPLVTLLTLAPVSVNGMGVREGGMILMLASAGVGAEQAVALSLLWFSVFLAAGLVGAGWYVSGRLPRCEVRNDAEPFRGDPDQGRTREPRAAA